MAAVVRYVSRDGASPVRGMDPGRSRQEGQRTARPVRRSRHPVGRRGVGGEPARQSGVQAPDPRNTGHRLPAWTAPTATGRDPGWQGVLRRRPPGPFCGRNLIPRIARPGIESGERLGRHRWRIERSIAWLFGYRRLTVRYEREGSHFHVRHPLARSRRPVAVPRRLAIPVWRAPRLDALACRPSQPLPDGLHGRE